MSSNQSTGISTFDAASPYRPGAADYNGCAKLDDAADPPDPQTMPNAEEWNGLCLTQIALAKVAPQLVVSVKQVAGTYSVDLFAALSNNITASDIHVDKNGTGDVSVHVLASKLANSNGGQAFRPKGSVNEDADLRARFLEFSGTISAQASRGARVKILNGAGAAAEGAFTVEIG